MITREKFIDRIGHEPVQDDLNRCNCPDAGKPGHHMCGWCAACDLPRFSCGCLNRDHAHVQVLANMEVFWIDLSNVGQYENTIFKIEVSTKLDIIPNFALIMNTSRGSIDLVLERVMGAGKVISLASEVNSYCEGVPMTHRLAEGVVHMVTERLRALVAEGRLARNAAGNWAGSKAVG